MDSRRPMYNENMLDQPAEVGPNSPTQQFAHHHQLLPMNPPPQHAYYEPAQYHYLPPPQQPILDQHTQHQYYMQHKPRAERPALVDPMWPSTATNDIYLHVDPTPTDYHLHNTTAPLDDIMLYPMQPAPREVAQSTRRSPLKSKKVKTERRSRFKEGGDSTYVLRIHEMLENAEKERHTHVVSWQPHGRAFRIHNEALFVSQVMPRYFKAKIGSFHRWLRAWGFIRMTEGKDRGAWYHRYFVRGVTSFCKDMTRQQMAHVMVDWPPAGQVPDFYSAASGSTLSEQQQPSESQQIITTNLSSHQNIKTQNPKRLRGTILEDLRQMLDDAENEGHTHIVGWMPHGQAFKIHNKALFEGLMPRYFKTAKVTHLNDTLRLWGFRRLKNIGRDKGCFYHKFFVRGEPSLSRHLTRVQMKDCMDNWPPIDGEPDLYSQGHSSKNDTTSVTLHPTTGMTQDASNPEGRLDDVQRTNHSTNDDQSLPTTALPTQGYNPSMPSVATQNPIQQDAAISNRGDGTYVLRLHEMLEDAEKEGHQHIVSWQPHGRAFRIHKEKEFVDHIMPRYFKAKMGSFLRWCRAWGFVRMTEGRDRGAWYHRYFVRGVTSLSRSLSRQEMLKAMEDWLPPGHIPNFYTSGTGGVLSESRHRPIEIPPNVTCKNPKQLRGTVPEDLRRMLEDAEEDNNTRIVSWLPHGRAFKVHDKVAFTKFVLPRYFKASKFTYFSDALRMWGWHRLKEGHDKGAYYHKLFIKDQPQLTRHLHRIQMKNSMTPWPPSKGEPNLYTSPPPLSPGIGDPETAIDAPILPVQLEVDEVTALRNGHAMSSLNPSGQWQDATD